MTTEFWWRSDYEPFVWHRVQPDFIGRYVLESGQGPHTEGSPMPGEMVWRKVCLDGEHWSAGTAPEGISSKPDESRPVCPWCSLPDGVDPIHAQLVGLRFSDDYHVGFWTVGALLAAATSTEHAVTYAVYGSRDAPSVEVFG